MNINAVAFRLLFLDSQIDEAGDAVERDKADARLGGGCEVAHAAAFAGSPTSIRLAIVDAKAAAGPRPLDPPSAANEYDQRLAAGLAARLRELQRGEPKTTTPTVEENTK